MSGFQISFNWPNLAASILIFAIAYAVRMRYHRRALARDHVAEVSRDVAIPRECVICTSPRAPYQLFVFSKAGLRRALWRRPYFRGSQSFLFHYCVRCSRSLLRRRRFGSSVIVGGIFVLLLVPLSVIVIKVSDAVRHLANIGHSDWFLWVVVAPFLVGPLLIATGITIYDSALPVSISDAGETIFFFFRSQQYRDLFAHLNGEDFGAG